MNSPSPAAEGPPADRREAAAHAGAKRRAL